MRQSMSVARTAEKKPKRGTKVRVAKGSALTRFVLGRTGQVLIAFSALLVIASVGAFTYYYAKYARLFDEKVRAGLFANSAKIFAAPDSVAVGETITAGDIAAR